MTDVVRAIRPELAFSSFDKSGGIQDLDLCEIEQVSAAGEVGDAIRAVGDSIQKIGDAAYDAGHRLGKAVRSLFD